MFDTGKHSGGEGQEPLPVAGVASQGTPEQRLVWVVGQPPSAATHAVLETLVDAPLPRRLQLLAAKAWDRQLSAMSAMSAAAQVTATVCNDGPDAQDAADAELALMLRRTDGEMGHQLHHHRRLLSLPVLFAAVREGECTPRHASAFLDITRDMSEDDVAAVDAAVSARAASMTVCGFRRVVRKTAARLDSRSPEERKKARRQQVGVRCYPQPDGLVTIAATMPAASGIALATELNRRADAARTPGDERTHGERQVDELLGAVFGAPSTTAAASAGEPRADAPVMVRPSRRVEVQVVIDWRSLVGLRDDPAELLGYGSITAGDVRAMLAEPGSVLRRLVTDPVTGVLVDYGAERYRPDAFLTGLTKARDVTCRYPGCTRNAMYCDDEHCEAFPRGATSAANVCQLCRRHHRRKTFDGFRYTRPDPATGKTVWTTPLGFTYVQEPATYDESGPDPGDTHCADLVEAEQRWIPPLPPDDPSDSTEPPDLPTTDDDPAPF